MVLTLRCLDFLFEPWGILGPHYWSCDVLTVPDGNLNPDDILNRQWPLPLDGRAVENATFSPIFLALMKMDGGRMAERFACCLCLG
jgi:hypothetical protein